MSAPRDRTISDRVGGSKIDTLTSMRFFAALAIVIHHLVDYGMVSRSANSYPLDIGVSFFFLLSGFVMFIVHGDMRSGEDRRSYIVARFARIYPLHIFTFALLIVLMGFEPARFGWPENGWLVACLNLLLLQAWVPVGTVFFSFNSVSWTISVEMFFYVAFIFLVVDFRRRWPFALVIGALLVAALSLLSDQLTVPGEEDVMHRVSAASLVYINPLARLFEFVMGMCVGLIWVTFSSRARLGKRWATVAELGAVLLFAANIALVVPVTVWVWQFSPSFATWLYHGGAACLSTAVVIFVFAQQSGYVSTVLRSPVLVFLGEISFSIYLVHQILLRAYGIQMDLFAGLSETGRLLLYCVVLLAVSALLWRLVEVPARGILRRAYARHQMRKTETRGSASLSQETSTG